MIYPLAHAVITQYFGEHPDDYLQYGYPGHNGIDLVTDDSPPTVYSVTSGRCVKVGWQEDGYGKYIVIETGGFQYFYCHLENVYIKPGEKILEGEPIGLMGSTGNSTGPHLHFGIRDKDGQGVIDYQGFINPLLRLSKCLQPEIYDLNIIEDKPFIPVKPKPKPVTHGKRTMYPRMKYF
jgi:murein DD-endopeptidase MepM/ murein hydrolase activator NlpD